MQQGKSANIVFRFLWFIGAGWIGYYLFKFLFWGRKGGVDEAGRESGGIFDNPIFADDEELRLKPISVNSFVYVLPTHKNEDGIFVKLLIENTSELATENI